MAKKASRATKGRKAAPKRGASAKRAPTRKKTPARKAATKKAAARKKTPARKTAAKKATAKKPAARKKTPARKATAKKPAARKKTPAKKALSKRALAREAVARKLAAKAAAPKKSTQKPTAKPSRKPPATRPAAKPPEPKKKVSRRTKSPYTARQLNPLRKALLELRARVARDMNLMGDEAFRASESEVDADDVADFGSDAFERTMTLNLLENEARNMQAIDGALEAMDNKIYGLCRECNESIPLARLEALPFAQTCVPCQEAQESML